MNEQEERFVEVALPVPLRKTFTYRVPVSIRQDIGHERSLLGMRVAVTFNRRKLLGVVVHVHSKAPTEFSARDLDVLVEELPIFNDELLSFLMDAAKYYFHPIGEVIQTAVPGIPKESAQNIGLKDWLENVGRLNSSVIGQRKLVLIHRTDQPIEGVRLGKAQKTVLERLDEHCVIEQTSLKNVLKQPSSVIQGLIKKGLVKTEEKWTYDDPFFDVPAQPSLPPELNQDQKEAVSQVSQAMFAEEDRQKKEGKGFLLFGVTGSGKTEVYLHLIQKALDQGKGSILLVPEIALTPQLVDRVRSRFGDQIAVLHSGITSRAKEHAWRKLQSGEIQIAVGARSALFAPVQHLGLVIVDEEHDSSFKQEEGFRYHGRDMALLRALKAKAVCVLGSATPSFESFFRAKAGKLELLSLHHRATENTLPDVEIVNLASHPQGPSGEPLISGPLYRALESCVSQGEQAILFLNRRGFSPTLICQACHSIQECPSCSVALTEHRSLGRLRCHYCDYFRESSGPCFYCQTEALKSLGLGTEQLQEMVEVAFPKIRVGRLDRDTASGKSVEKILARFKRHDLDVLIGTQMVAKGHDVANVTLVGVVLADQSLSVPDFRAAERTFQLLEQVSGRAGRGEKKGKVIFQTFQPGHNAIQSAASHDYVGFYQQELPKRESLLYPPHGFLAVVRAHAADLGKAKWAIHQLELAAKKHVAVQSEIVEVVGPAPAPIEKIRGRFRFHFLLRSSSRKALRDVVASVVHRLDQGISPSRGSVDLDPVSLM